MKISTYPPGSRVDLNDGLQHFGDTDSVAGTLEERALVKAVDDGDPRTIEVIVVRLKDPVKK